jgi:hypothetical protein
MELVIPFGFFPWHQYTCSSVHIRNDLLYHENGSSLPKFGQYLAFYYFSKTSMAISLTTKLSSYTISARLCYPVKFGSQLAFPHYNTGIAGSNP